MAANPYLAHLSDQSNGRVPRSKVDYSNGSIASGSGYNSRGSNGSYASTSNGVNNALDGFVPRTVRGDQCNKAMVSFS